MTSSNPKAQGKNSMCLELTGGLLRTLLGVPALSRRDVVAASKETTDASLARPCAARS